MQKINLLALNILKPIIQWKQLKSCCHRFCSIIHQLQESSAQLRRKVAAGSRTHIRLAAVFLLSYLGLLDFLTQPAVAVSWLLSAQKLLQGFIPVLAGFLQHPQQSVLPAAIRPGPRHDVIAVLIVEDLLGVEKEDNVVDIHDAREQLFLQRSDDLGRKRKRNYTSVRESVKIVLTWCSLIRAAVSPYPVIFLHFLHEQRKKKAIACLMSQSWELTAWSAAHSFTASDEIEPESISHVLASPTDVDRQ